MKATSAAPAVRRHLLTRCRINIYGEFYGGGKADRKRLDFGENSLGLPCVADKYAKLKWKFRNRDGEEINFYHV